MNKDAKLILQGVESGLLTESEDLESLYQQLDKEYQEAENIRAKNIIGEARDLIVLDRSHQGHNYRQTLLNRAMTALDWIEKSC